MLADPAIAAVLRDYPRIYFGCHRRHTRDPLTGDLVSQKQVQILDHLDEFSAHSLNALADHMGVTPGTMSVAVDRLVKRGYVTRVPDSTDRRRVLLRLTPSGARVCQAHSVLDPELVHDMLAALPDADRVRALEGLALLASAAGRATAARKQRMESTQHDERTA
jgi:DNA-binding MarR family transcriptional regulator